MLADLRQYPIKQGISSFPTTHPCWTRIQSAIVEAASVPEVEIIAPGKVEANPTKVSKIVLPVTGRVGASARQPGRYSQAGATCP